MATTGSSPLNLTKPEANDVVDLAVINSNYDTINTFAGNTNTDLATKTGQISTLNTAVGAAGTVQNAVKATNVAGGSIGRIPIQSAADTTVFVSNAGSAGQVLFSQPTSPYAVWGNPSPFRIATGIATIGAGGTLPIVYTSAFGAGILPVVSLTPVATNLNLATVASVSSSSNTGFTINLRAQSTAGGNFAASSGTVHWTAIQYLGSGDGTGS
jgi:hypothetical protein